MEVKGDFCKSCGVIRLEARSQSLKEDVGGEETVIQHAYNVSEMFDPKLSHFKEDISHFKADTDSQAKVELRSFHFS